MINESERESRSYNEGIAQKVIDGEEGENHTKRYLLEGNRNLRCGR
jgi:hypothetical protein